MTMGTDKKIWIGILLLAVAIQVFFIAKRVHNFPFMIYDMYSRPVDAQEEQMHYRLIADTDTIDLIALPKFQEGRIIQYLDMYRIWMETGGNEVWSSALDQRVEKWSWLSKDRADRLLTNGAEAYDQFPGWLHDYIVRYVTRQPFDRLRVEYVRFDQASDERDVIQILFES